MGVSVCSVLPRAPAVPICWRGNQGLEVRLPTQVCAPVGRRGLPRPGPHLLGRPASTLSLDGEIGLTVPVPVPLSPWWASRSKRAGPRLLTC